MWSPTIIGLPLVLPYQSLLFDHQDIRRDKVRVTFITRTVLVHVYLGQLCGNEAGFVITASSASFLLQVCCFVLFWKAGFFCPCWEMGRIWFYFLGVRCSPKVWWLHHLGEFHFSNVFTSILIRYHLYCKSCRQLFMTTLVYVPTCVDHYPWCRKKGGSLNFILRRWLQ